MGRPSGRSPGRPASAPAGLLHHFESKEQLLHAVLDARDADDLANADIKSDPIEQLQKVAQRFERSPELIGMFTVLLTENLNPDAPLHDRFLARYRLSVEIIAGGIRRGPARGPLPHRPGPGHQGRRDNRFPHWNGDLMVARSVDAAERGLSRVHQLTRQAAPVQPAVRHSLKPRMAVIAPTAAEAVRSAGGWLFDQVLAGLGRRRDHGGGG